MIWLIQSTKLFKIEEIMIPLKGEKSQFRGHVWLLRNVFRHSVLRLYIPCAKNQRGGKQHQMLLCAKEFEPQCPRFPLTPG